MLLIAALQYFLVAIIIEIMHKNFAYINANIIFQLIYLRAIMWYI